MTTPEAPFADPRQRELKTTGNMVLRPSSSEHTQQQPIADNQGVIPSGRDSGKRKRSDNQRQIRLTSTSTDTSYDNRNATQQSTWTPQQTRSNYIGNKALIHNNIHNSIDNDDLSPRTHHPPPTHPHSPHDKRPTPSRHRKRKRQDNLHLDGTRRLPRVRQWFLRHSRQAMVIQTAWRSFSAVSSFQSNLMRITLVQMLVRCRAARDLVAQRRRERDAGQFSGVWRPLFEHRQATVLQTAWRNFSAGSRFHSTLKQITVVQTLIRGRAARN